MANVGRYIIFSMALRYILLSFIIIAMNITDD
ncbi:MAG TPA: hypothetical protein VEY68_00130 [Anoxybacillus sp.]|nr:hypothetical protein [Anoxybacillus sp.]